MLNSHKPIQVHQQRLLWLSLTQESALGANVGKCYLTDATTGYGINSKTNAVMKNTMKPTRDVQPFIKITESLGMDWKKTLISCPIAGVAGWGGAMGPAQFIASTWQSIAHKVAAITGSSNPWNARDSIVGSATYLSDLGALVLVIFHKSKQHVDIMEQAVQIVRMDAKLWLELQRFRQI
jgi:membrane-bound lytic murein transglycosylase B